MPDWISHMLIGLILAKMFNLKRKSLVVLGALLPDFIIKISTLGFFVDMPLSLYWFLVPGHLPIGLILITIFITPFFLTRFKATFTLITIGWMSHVLADLSTRFFMNNPQGMLLFPLSWRMFSYQLIWPEEYYIAIIILGPLYIGILAFEKLKSKPVIA